MRALTMSASILSNVRANVMTEQQQLVCSKAEKCGLQGFCIELSDQFSSPELYRSLSFEDRMNQCLDREHGRRHSCMHQVRGQCNYRKLSCSDQKGNKRI